MFLAATLLACSAPDEAAAPALRLSSTIETVALAEWAPDLSADERWVEFGADTTYGSVAPETGPGRATLLGTPAGALVHARIATRFGDEVEYSDDMTLTTGETPEFLTDLGVRDDTGAEFGSWIFTSLNLMSGAAGSLGSTQTVIFDRAGRVVWYDGPQAGFVAAARPSRDGRAIVYIWRESVSASDTAKICRAELSGEETVCASTPGATHDFVEMPDGGYTYGKEDIRAFEDYQVTGNSLVTISAEGVETTVWSVWDELTPVPDARWEDLQGGLPIDWTHFNGLWYDEPSNDWYLSFLYLKQIRKVSGATGHTEWALGGTDGDFELVGDPFGPQHAPQLIDGGLLLFDNHYGSEPSRLSAWALDETNFVATQTLSIEHPDHFHNVVLGDAHLLANGHYAAAFGDTGDLFVFSPEGEVEWSMYPPDGTIPGQVYVYDDLYAMTPT